MSNLSTDTVTSVMRRNAELIAKIRTELDIISSADGHVRLEPASFTPGEGWVGRLPPLYPEWLGDPGFLKEHGIRFPYVAGAMANGIATALLVAEMGRASMLGFFGSAGLSPPAIERGLTEIEQSLAGTRAVWGANLINSPNEPQLEADAAALFLARRVERVSASAYMSLTPPVVRYACTGLRRTDDGRILRSNHVFAKVSRPEVAVHFMRPAPSGILEQLVASGQLTREEAQLGSTVPLAAALTAEADSGGHTDHRPLSVLLPALLQLRNEIEATHGYEGAICIGAAGGLGTPAA
ncbi:MAG: 2-nitropropane dioxygenase, partial [Myxococcota bacterium]